MQDRVYSLLGIATKAGRTKSGGFQTVEAIQKGWARLVILSADARENTIHEIKPKCESRGIPVRFYGTKEDLGHAMGKELRSCAAVTDQGFATSIMRIIDQTNQEASASSDTESLG